MRARLLDPFQRFFSSEAAGGIVLLVCTAIALAWANSPWGNGYASLLHHAIPVGGGRFALELTVHE